MQKPRIMMIWLTVVIMLLSIVSMAGAAPTASAGASISSPFTDITASDPALPYVNYLAGKNIIKGYPDGSYHPNSGLTRAEAAVVISKAAGLAIDPAAAVNFRDVAGNHWAKGYIAAAAKAGYLKGNPDNTFRPDQQLTRAEGISLIFRLSKSDLSSATLPALTDMNERHWAAQPIAAALSAGMVGLSADKTQFMPNVPFSRINLAQALGILLTEDPSLSKTALPGTLKPVTGKITLKKAGSSQEEIITKETGINPGDIITSVKGAKAEVNYPDGSSLLIKDDTQVIVKAAEGKKYIKLDGSEGIGVDWLNVDIKKGTMFTALATRRDSSGTAASTDNKTSYGLPSVMATLASLDPTGIIGKLAADPPKQQAWYATAQTKKVKVQVDMPWGVAAVRGTFALVSVSESGQSNVSCLTGNVEVTAGGQTVPLGQNQTTGLQSPGTPPPPPAQAPPEVTQEFAEEQDWLAETAENMDQNQAAPPPPPPPPAPQNTPPPPPPPPSSTLSAINTALTAGGANPIGSQSPSPNTPANNSGNSGSGEGNNNTNPTTTASLDTIYNGNRNFISISFNGVLSSQTLSYMNLNNLVTVSLQSGSTTTPLAVGVKPNSPWIVDGNTTRMIIYFNQFQQLNAGDTVNVTLSSNIRGANGQTVSPLQLTGIVQADTTAPSAQIVNANAGKRDWIGLRFNEELAPDIYNQAYSSLNSFVEVYIGDDTTALYLANRVKWSFTTPGSPGLVIPFYPITLTAGDHVKVKILPNGFKDAAGNYMPTNILTATVTDDNVAPMVHEYTGSYPDGKAMLEYSELVNTAAAGTSNYSTSALNPANYTAIRLDNNQPVRIETLAKDETFTGHTVLKLVFNSADTANLAATVGIKITVSNVTDLVGLTINPQARVTIAYTGSMNDLSGAEAYIDGRTIHIEEARGQDGNYYNDDSKYVYIKMAGDTSATIKKQEIDFINGSAEIELPAWLDLPSIYELLLVIDDVTNPIPVIYDIPDFQSVATATEDDEFSNVAITSVSESYTEQLALQHKDKIRLYSKSSDEWLPMAGMTYLNASYPQFAGDYMAFQEDDTITVKEYSGSWTSFEGTFPGSGNPFSLDHGSYGWYSDMPYVACNESGQVMVYAYGESGWESLAAGPPVSGGLDIKIDRGNDIPYLACVNYGLANVYFYWNNSWNFIGFPAAYNVTNVSLAIHYGVPYLACATADGYITIWEYKEDGWHQMGNQLRGTNPVLKIADSGTLYLAFIDDAGTASLFRYAYLGKNELNLPYYVWIGGKLHPDGPADEPDIDISLHLIEDHIYVAYTSSTEAQMVSFIDPLNGIYWSFDGDTFIDRPTTAYDMGCTVNGNVYNWNYDGGLRIVISDPAVFNNPDAEIIITLLDTGQAIRIVPYIGSPQIIGRVTGMDHIPLDGVTVRIFDNTGDECFFPPIIEVTTDTSGYYKVPLSVLNQYESYRMTFAKQGLELTDRTGFIEEVQITSPDTLYNGTIAYSGSSPIEPGNYFELRALNDNLSYDSWMDIFNTIKSKTNIASEPWIEGIEPNLLECEISYDGSLLRVINNSGTDTALINTYRFIFPCEQVYDWAGNQPTEDVILELS